MHMLLTCHHHLPACSGSAYVAYRMLCRAVEAAAGPVAAAPLAAALWLRQAGDRHATQALRQAERGPAREAATSLLSILRQQANKLASGRSLDQGKCPS